MLTEAKMLKKNRETYKEKQEIREWKKNGGSEYYTSGSKDESLSEHVMYSVRLDQNLQLLKEITPISHEIIHYSLNPKRWYSPGLSTAPDCIAIGSHPQSFLFI